MTAEIHNFPPEHIARPLVFDAIFANDGNYLKESSADESWWDRCKAINNLFVQATEAWAKCVDAEGGPESAPESFREFVETTLLALHLAAADVIEGSGMVAPISPLIIETTYPVVPSIWIRHACRKIDSRPAGFAMWFQRLYSDPERGLGFQGCSSTRRRTPRTRRR